MEAASIFLPFALTIFLTGWWHNVCKKTYAPGPFGRGALGGGWLPAGVLMVLLVCFGFFPSRLTAEYVHPLIFMQFSSLLVLAVGLASLARKNDRTAAPLEYWKFGLAIALILVFTIAFVGAGFLNIPFLADKALLFVGWLIILRGIFVTDRADGAAIIHAVGILFPVALLNPKVAFIILPVIGSIIGFLRLNFPRASLFWGAAGRLWLATIVGGLWALGLNYTNDNSQTACLFALLLPLFLNSIFTTTPWQNRAQDLGMPDKSILKRLISLYVLLLIFIIVAFVAKAPVLFATATASVLLAFAMRIRHLENSPQQP